MPQLDTSAWFITIMSMFMILFIMFQLKISKHSHPGNLGPESSVTLKQPNPWEKNE